MVSCSPRSTGERLHRADSLLMDEPEAAAATLDSINPSDLRSKADRIFFDLLSTEISYKLNELPKSDSLIQTVVDFYDRQDDSSLRGRAYFQLANILASQQRYGEALVAYLNAEHSANLAQNHLLHALVYRGIADTFSDLTDHASAYDYYTRSYNEFQKASANKYLDWCIYNIGRELFCTQQYEKCIALVDSLHQTPSAKNNPALLKYTLQLKASSLRSLERFEEAKKIFEYLHNSDYKISSFHLMRDLAVCYLNTNATSRAIEINDSLLKVAPDDHLLTLFIKANKKEYEEAYHLLQNELDEQNDYILNIYHRNYAATIRDFYEVRQHNSQEIIKLERHRRYISIAVLVVTIILICLLSLYSIKSYRKKVTEQMEIASNLQNTLLGKEEELRAADETKETAIRKLLETKNDLDKATDLYSQQSMAIAAARNSLRTLMQTQFNDLNQLCTTFYQHNGSKNAKTKIYQEVVQKVNDIRNNKNVFSKLEDTINICIPGLMQRFRNDHPTLHEYEYALYILLILGFSSQAISFLQDIRIDAVYNRKATLKKKIIAGNPNSAAQYLSFLN